MPVTSVALNAAITWQLARANTGFADTVQGSDTSGFNANALSTTTWNEVFAANYTLAAAGTQAVDFRTFTDLAGTSVTGDKILAVIVTVTGAVTDRLNVKKHGTTGLQWFFQTPAVGDADAGIDIPGGGMFMFSEGITSTGTTLDASNKQWLLTNNGAAALTVEIVALVSDT